MNQNILIDVDKIPELLKQNYQFIDIRDAASFKKEHLQRFINIPLQQFDEYTSNIIKNIPVVLICYSGKTSHEIALKLNQQGYTCYSIYGGYQAVKATEPNPSYY